MKLTDFVMGQPLTYKEIEENLNLYFFSNLNEKDDSKQILFIRDDEESKKRALLIIKPICDHTLEELEKNYFDERNKIDSLAINDDERKKRFKELKEFFKLQLLIKAYIDKPKFKRLFDIGICNLFDDYTSNYTKINEFLKENIKNIPFYFWLSFDFLIDIQHSFYTFTDTTLNDEIINDKNYYYTHTIDDFKNHNDENTLFNKIKKKYNNFDFIDYDDFFINLNCYIADTEEIFNKLLDLSPQQKNEIIQEKKAQLNTLYKKLYRTSPQAIEEDNIFKKYNGRDLTQNKEIITEKGKHANYKILPIMRSQATQENIKYIGYKGYNFLLLEEIDKYIFNYIINQKNIKAIFQYKEDKKRAEKENKPFNINKDYENVINRCNNGKITTREIESLFDEKTQLMKDFEKEADFKFDFFLLDNFYEADTNKSRAFATLNTNLYYMHNILIETKKNINGYNIKGDYSKIYTPQIMTHPITHQKTFFIRINENYKKICVIDYLKNNFATASNINQIAENSKGAESSFIKNAIILFYKLEDIYETEHTRKIESRAAALKTTTQNIVSTEYYKDFNYITFFSACKEAQIITGHEESPIKEMQKIYNSLTLLKQENYIKDFIWLKKEDEAKEHEKTFEEMKENTLFIIKENGKLKPLSKEIKNRINETKILIQYTPKLEEEKYKLKDFTNYNKELTEKEKIQEK